MAMVPDQTLPNAYRCAERLLKKWATSTNDGAKSAIVPFRSGVNCLPPSDAMGRCLVSFRHFYQSSVADCFNRLLDQRIDEPFSGNTDHLSEILTMTIHLVADVLRGPVLLVDEPNSLRESLIQLVVQELQRILESSLS